MELRVKRVRTPANTFRCYIHRKSSQYLEQKLHRTSAQYLFGIDSKTVGGMLETDYREHIIDAGFHSAE